MALYGRSVTHATAVETNAVKYQILIMFLICVGTGFGVMTAITLTSRKLFDDRDRIRLEVLEKS